VALTLREVCGLTTEEIVQAFLVRLDEQDRSLWDRRQIAAGIACVERAFGVGTIGVYTLQAAIAAIHAAAPSADATDWARIVALYDLLLGADASPVVELKRAVAVTMRDGPQAGLALAGQAQGRRFLEQRLASLPA
jgi:RNA polymerase sigma-70 factor (ECF subfamily)